MTRTHAHRLIVGIALIATTTACAGPSTPLNVSLREFPQNVRLGDGKAADPVIAPIPPVAPVIRVPLLPGPVTEPVAPTDPSARPSSPTTAAPCPEAELGTTPLDEVGIAVRKPASSQLLSYRARGKHTTGGSMASTVDYPEQSTRHVGAAVPTVGAGGEGTGFTYDVTTAIGTTRTVTTYGVVFQDTAAALPGEVRNAGLFVNQIKRVGPDGKVVSSFTPSPPMMVVPFPADEGVTFSVASTDVTTGTSVTYNGVVGKHVVVDACGQVIDTRRVTHTGTVNIGTCGSRACTSDQIGTGDTTTFTGTYDLALQYGGLSVQDEVHVEGLGLDHPFRDDLHSVVSSVPQGAA